MAQQAMNNKVPQGKERLSAARLGASLEVMAGEQTKQIIWSGRVDFDLNLFINGEWS
jgi:hypothetical protein